MKNAIKREPCKLVCRWPSVSILCNKKTIITALLALVTMAGQGQEPFFRTDSAFIIGKVNGIAPQAMPKQIIVAWNNAMTNNMRDKTVDVSADGDFTCRMQLHHPVLSNLVISENNMVPFYLMPGETLHMELKQDADGHWTCNYGDGSAAKKVERLLKANLDYTNEYRMMIADNSDLKRHTALCDSLIRATLGNIEAMADARQFTPYERQLAQTMATSAICEGFLFRHGVLCRADLNRTFTDSLYRAELCAPEYYAPLKYLPLNDPVLFVPYSYSPLATVLATTPVCALATFMSYYAVEIQQLRQAMNRMTGDEDNLLTQMAMMQILPKGLTRAAEAYVRRQQALADTTLTAEDRAAWEASAYVPLDTVRHRALDGITQPELRKEAERLFTATFDESIAYPIPEGDGKALLERIIQPYRGKFVLIDFWAMSCGPCKQAIEKSRDLRRQLQDNPDLRLIFIAQEDAPETSEAYKQYVRENLLGADCYPVSRKELGQMMELLRFGGVPHYVTISPDGQIMRNSLNYFSNNYDLFLQRLDEMKVRLSGSNETKNY